MNMTYSFIRNAFGRIIMLGLGLAVLPACGQILDIASDPVLVDAKCNGTLRVRITTDTMEDAADIAPPYNYGVYDYLRNLNDTQGGIRGCPIDVDVKEAQYDPAATATVIDAWRAAPTWAEVSTLFIFGTGPTTLVAQELMQEKKLIIPGSYAGSLSTPVKISKDVPYPEINATGESFETTEHKDSPGYPYLFFPATDYSTAIRIGIQAAWKIDAGRIAMVHDTADECLYCVDPLVAGKSYVEQLPGMLLGEDLLVPQTTKPEDEPLIVNTVVDYIKKEIAKKQANSSYEPVRWLWSGNSVFSSSLVGKGAAAAQAIINESFTSATDRWTLRVMANNWGIGETTPSICGPSCAKIFYGLFPVPRYGDVQRAIGMTTLMETHQAYRRKDGHPLDLYRDVRYVQGYAAAIMWHKAVEMAIDTGHTTPTGEDLKNALESFQGVDLRGMTAGPISFSPKDHRPQSNESVYVLNDQGELTFVDGYSIELNPNWLGY
jgi:ABC-type branched-subunit amino acid transport system substrate-binding protein